jgi:hypothetical protein
MEDNDNIAACRRRQAIFFEAFVTSPPSYSRLNATAVGFAFNRSSIFDLSFHPI